MDNTVCEASNTGIYGEHGCVIERNITCQNSQSDTRSACAGIKALGDCIIRGNVALDHYVPPSPAPSADSPDGSQGGRGR
jgi:hypothetical protein